MTNPRTPGSTAKPTGTGAAPPLRAERKRAYDVHSPDGRALIDVAVGEKVDTYLRPVREIAAALPGLEATAAAASLKRLRVAGKVWAMGERGLRKYARAVEKEAGR